MSELRRGLLMVTLPMPVFFVAYTMIGSGVPFLEAVGLIGIFGSCFVGSWSIFIGLIHIVYGLIEEPKK